MLERIKRKLGGEVEGVGVMKDEELTILSHTN